jgi:hypothetical protein
VGDRWIVLVSRLYKISASNGRVGRNCQVSPQPRAPLRSLPWPLIAWPLASRRLPCAQACAAALAPLAWGWFALARAARWHPVGPSLQAFDPPVLGLTSPHPSQRQRELGSESAHPPPVRPDTDGAVIIMQQSSSDPEDAHEQQLLHVLTVVFMMITCG